MERIYVKKKIAAYKAEDFSEGQSFTLTRRIDKSDVDNFAAVSGDINSLHMRDEFARARGFSGRVVHGVLLTGYISQVIGVHFPGENCLLQSLNFKFPAPAYIGDIIQIKAVVDQVSPGVNTFVLNVNVKNIKSGAVLVKGKMQIGFTAPRKAV